MRTQTVAKSKNQKSKKLALEIVENHGKVYAVVEVPSQTNPDKKYRVDVTNGRCSCPSWIFSKGHTKVCKHLLALGFSQKIPATATAKQKQAEKVLNKVFQTLG